MVDVRPTCDGVRPGDFDVAAGISTKCWVWHRCGRNSASKIDSATLKIDAAIRVARFIQISGQAMHSRYIQVNVNVEFY